MVFRSAVVYGCVCVGGALFVLRIADKVHARRMVQRWSHRLELEKLKRARKERFEVIYSLEKCGERERRVLGR